MVFDIYTLVEALWVILPAYAANGLVPIFKGRHPIDFDRNFPDGKPILGKGKTWEGLFLGCLFGALIGLVEMLAFPFLPWSSSPVELNIISMTPILGFVIGFGAMSGDIVASFLKRRAGMKRGAMAPILDQDDFIVGAFIFASLLISVQISWVILFLIITPILHLGANYIAYRLKIKKTPW